MNSNWIRCRISSDANTAGSAKCNYSILVGRALASFGDRLHGCFKKDASSSSSIFFLRTSSDYIIYLLLLYVEMGNLFLVVRVDERTIQLLNDSFARATFHDDDSLSFLKNNFFI